MTSSLLLLHRDGVEVHIEDVSLQGSAGLDCNVNGPRVPTRQAQVRAHLRYAVPPSVLWACGSCAACCAVL